MSPTEHHLKIQLDELRRQYGALTDRIAALDTDIGRELDSERKLTLQKRRAELEAERDRVATQIPDERILGASKDGRQRMIGRPPYKGLQFFDIPDADLFAGREFLTAKLVKRLREGRFLAVVGASGSGKSSIVRAGLVPSLIAATELADGTLPPAGSDRWSVHIITPTARPLKELASSLTRDSESIGMTTGLVEDMLQNPSALDFAASKFLKRNPQWDRLLLLIDQFEELFTACKDERERKVFIDNIMTAVSLDGPMVVVIALRADFYPHCAQFDNLREYLSRRQEYIGPMDRSELQRAIEEPARRNGWSVAPGLVELILHDVGQEPGALPLLSHALLETWRRRDEHSITIEGYTDSGGVRGAISRTATMVYEQLTPAQQLIARNILLRLTELGEGTQDTRRRATLNELRDTPEDAPAVQAVLMKLADARLITLGEETAEVAHEALIREWPLLKRWLDDNRESLRIHRPLTEAAQAWARLKKDPSDVYRGARLAAAIEWAETHDSEMTTLEREFLLASRKSAEEEDAKREAQQQRELDAARKLADAERRRAETVEQLREVSAAISATLDLDKVLTRIVEGAARLTQANSGILYLLTENDLLKQSFEWPTETQHLEPRVRPDFALTIKSILSTRQPIFVQTSEADAGFGSDILGNAIRSFAGIPLQYRDTIIGVLFVNYVDLRQLSTEELALLSTLSDQAAVAIENATLHDHISKNLERRIRELKALTNIGKTISTVGLDSVLDLVYHQICDIMDLSDAIFFVSLYDPAENAISFPLVIERDNGVIIDAIRWGLRDKAKVSLWVTRKHDAAYGLTEYVLALKQPVLISTEFAQTAQTLGIQVPPNIGRLDRTTKCWMSVPMIVGDRSIGTISVQSLEREWAYDESHLELLSAVANQAAIAIENTRLYEEARSEAIANKQLAALGTATAAIQHRVANSLGIIMPNVLRLKKRIDPSDASVIEILDIIERNVRYTSDLLHRIQSPLQQLERQIVDVNSLLTETAYSVLDRQRQRFGAERIEVRLLLDEARPTVEAPIGRLADVFTSLVENGLQAMGSIEGGLLTISSERTETVVRVLVHDTGTGIPSHILTQLFNKPIPPKDPTRGTGLGLWLSKLVLQSIGGSIFVQQTGPKGTVMLVELPVLGDRSHASENAPNT